MFTSRITRTAAVALAIAAAAAPAASARPLDLIPNGPGTSQDLRNPDTRDIADGRRVDTPAPASAQPQDLRNPDTRDYADGRGTHNAPTVVVVDTPKPVVEPPAADGIDWADVGIGAGGLLGASLIALGGALFVVHRRSPQPRTAR
jgi:hypothetical protein